MASLYEILEVPQDATQDKIRAAYRRLVQQVHPDRRGSKSLFRQVQTAYETLTDLASRARYDRDLLADHKEGEASQS